MRSDDLRRVFDRVRLDPDRQEELLEELLAEEEGKEIHIMGNDRAKAKRRRFSPRAAAAAAVAAALLCGSVLAVSAGLDRRLLEFLGATTAEQAEPLIAGAQAVNKTVKNAGSTLTVREVLGDRDNLYLLLNFTAPEGTVLDAYDYRFRQDSVTVESRSDWKGIGYTKLEDDDPGDNSLDLVMHIKADSISKDGTMTLRLGELEAASGYGEPYVSLDIPGEWKVSFPLRCGDSSLTWEMRLPVNLYGQEALVTEASLSPLSVTVKGTGETLEAAVEAARASGVQGFFPVTICFRDGTGLTTSREAGDGFTALVQNGRDFYTNWTLHQIIDLDQVDYLIFGDTVIPVAQEEK